MIAEVRKEPHTIVVKTLISGKPPDSAKIAPAISMGAMTLASYAYWENWRGIAAQLPGIPSRVFSNGEYWRLFTGMFIHSDIRHLISNFFGMGILSFLVYGYFGAAVILPLCLILGPVVNALSLLTYPMDASLMGASGVVYLLAGFWLSAYVGIDRRYSLGSRLMRSLGFTLAMLVPSTIEPQVSYRTHTIGFVVGALVGALYFLARREKIRGFERVEIEDDT